MAAKRSLGEQLTLPLDFETDRMDAGVRRFMSALILLVVGVLAVMGLSPVREVAIAPGELKPAGDVAVVRHLTGGEVEAFLAAEGQQVADGAPILRLSARAQVAELRRAEARLAHLRLDQAVLDALITARPLADDAPAPSPGARANARARLEAERAAEGAERDGATARIAQRREQARADAAEAEALTAEIAAYDGQIEILTALRSRTGGRRPQVLELEARRAQAGARRAELAGSAERSAAAIREIEQASAQAAAARRADWTRRRAEIGAEIAELAARAGQLKREIDRAVVRAPVSGVVQSFGELSRGGVAAAGGVVAEIVPDAEELVAEVRIAPDDVGHIPIGSSAVVRITTFDAARTGDVTAYVSRVSPTAFAAPDGERYFSAVLKLDRLNPDSPARRLALSAGMTALAEIRTGEKSILRYLFKPVVSAAERAFAER